MDSCEFCDQCVDHFLWEALLAWQDERTFRADTVSGRFPTRLGTRERKRKNVRDVSRLIADVAEVEESIGNPQIHPDLRTPSDASD